MVRAKKGKRTGKEDDTDDDNDSTVVGDSIKENTSGLKSRKDGLEDDEYDGLAKKSDKKTRKGKKGNVDSDDEKSSKKKLQKLKSVEDSDDEGTDDNVKRKTKKKVDQSDSDNDDEREETEKINRKKSKKSKGKTEVEDEDEGGDRPKRKGKKKQDDSDEEVERVSNKKSNKKEKKKVVESEDDDDEISNSTKSKKKKGKNKNRGDSDDDTEEEAKKSKPKAAAQKPRGGFALLQIDDGDSDDDVEEPPERPDTPDEPIIEKSKPSQQDKGGKKSKKKNKKKDDDEEDIEKVLAELQLEYSGQKPKEETNPNEDEQLEEKQGKKAKKKKKEKEKEEDGDGEEKKVEEEEEEGETLKTAAQKKKEKKKKQAQKKDETTADEKTETGENDKTEMKPSTNEDKPDKEDGEEEKKGKKDKKKKNKDKEKEKEKEDKTKGPGKKTIAAMQEALKKIKEEEERQKKEEEERIRREEEAEAARQEALRLEKERKEKKKQKEKERKERLKAEGKLLTAKQKADKARAQEMINALRAQGLELPDPGEKKPRPGTRVKPSKLKSQVSQDSVETSEGKPTEAAPSTPEQVQVEIVDTTPEAKPEEHAVSDVKDTWDAESSEEEDASEKAEHEKPAKPAQPAAQVKPERKEESDDESESDEDDEEEDEDESSEEESESEDEHKTDAEKKRDKAMARILKRQEDALKNRSSENLRAAVVCVLGHVDTGKTKILDKLRRTNVQDGEAGGITQQIGATNVPIENIKENSKLVKGFSDMELKIPGLLIIDTPGHESFSNLRSRGSSLCDIAILVVDIMHGLEPQTLESINLLKSRKTPFIVALNKVDRLYNWQTGGRKDIRDILKAQAENTQLEFKQRTQEVTVQFAEQGLNAALFFENPDIRSYVSLVPTSAITGEGMGNLLALIVEFCQTMLAKRLIYSELLQATVLEVKAIPGLGTTIDAILINGKLREGDTMILAGTDGPIVTQIRSLLMPQPMKELRVKNAYIEYKEIKAAQGVKIAAKDLEKAIAGLNLQVAQRPDEVEIFSEEVAKELKSALSSIKLKERGVYVQASTLGSLEALLEFLRTSKIPYSNIRIGPVVKKDVMKASTMLEHESQYATILAFDVKIERDAQELADSLGVKIFQADIIYHLFDKFMAYREELKQKKRDEFKNIAVFPCKLKILPQFVFNTRDPIVVGVMVEAGIVREGTPLCVPSKEFVNIGVVTSVEVNHKQMESARKGQEVCIKIENPTGETPKLYGRHFDHTDALVSKISRQSIDACKDYFRDDLTKQDWQLMVELKKLFQIL